MIRDRSVEVVVVWTTFPSEKDPVPFARTLVEERLAACVTGQDGLRSIYRWRDQIENETEHHLMIKTTAGRVEALKRRFAELHPSEVPEFLVLPIVDCSQSYLDWVRESTEPQVSVD